MKIVTFDIENTPATVFTWDLWPTGISHDNIIGEWSIICAAYKYLGKDKVYALQVSKVGDDYELCYRLRDVLADADIVVGHNIDKFDIRKLNARLIFHGLDPLPKLTTVDTLKVAKRTAAFLSNRLDYLGKHLLGQGKVHVDYQLWLDVMKGSKQAIKTMVEYNKVDVIRDEQLYLKLRPYMKTHPHSSVLNGGEKIHCPKCSSSNVIKAKVRVTAAGTKQQQWQCKACGGYHTTAMKPTK